jgi:hypothetical protein
MRVYISPSHMTREDYERVIEEVRGSESDGQCFHAAHSDYELELVEVRNSPEQFHGDRDKLFVHLLEVGCGGGNLEIHSPRSRRA